MCCVINAVYISYLVHQHKIQYYILPPIDNTYARRCIPTVDRPDVYTEQEEVAGGGALSMYMYYLVLFIHHRIPHGQRFCNGCPVCVGNGIGEY